MEVTGIELKCIETLNYFLLFAHFGFSYDIFFIWTNTKLSFVEEYLHEAIK